jgi:hypothetical protein
VTTFPGRSAARSGALQTRDRTNSESATIPDQQCTTAAPHPGNPVVRNASDVDGRNKSGQHEALLQRSRG